MYFNFTQLQTIITLLVGLTTVYGFINKFFADRQKKKLEEILDLVRKGFVTKEEFENYKLSQDTAKKHLTRRMEHVEIAVFMQKNPLLAKEIELREEGS